MNEHVITFKDAQGVEYEMMTAPPKAIIREDLQAAFDLGDFSSLKSMTLQGNIVPSPAERDAFAAIYDEATRFVWIEEVTNGKPRAFIAERIIDPPDVTGWQKARFVPRLDMMTAKDRRAFTGLTRQQERAQARAAKKGRKS